MDLQCKMGCKLTEGQGAGWGGIKGNWEPLVTYEELQMGQMWISERCPWLPREEADGRRKPGALQRPSLSWNRAAGTLSEAGSKQLGLLQARWSPTRKTETE